MNKSEAINELAKALATAQGQLENATKNKENAHFKQKYADLAEILNVVRPVLSEHGLSVVQLPSYDAGIVSVETVLMHASGQWISTQLSAPVGKMDAQGVGSATTYLRRFSLAAIVGVAQEDDDGQAAIAPPPKMITKVQQDALIKILEGGSEGQRTWFADQFGAADKVPAAAYDKLVAGLKKKIDAAKASETTTTEQEDF